MSYLNTTRKRDTSHLLHRYFNRWPTSNSDRNMRSTMRGARVEHCCTLCCVTRSAGLHSLGNLNSSSPPRRPAQSTITVAATPSHQNTVLRASLGFTNSSSTGWWRRGAVEVGFIEASSSSWPIDRLWLRFVFMNVKGILNSDIEGCSK